MEEANTRNTILPDGKIAGLDVSSGERIFIRDDDGTTGPAPQPPIQVTIYDHMKSAAGSQFNFLFDADPWDSLISFEPGISVELGGSLGLDFEVGVDRETQRGRTLRLFDWTGVTPSGQFDVSDVPDWNVTKLYTTGEVTLRGVPEPSAALIMLVGVTAIAMRRRLRRTSTVGVDR